MDLFLPIWRQLLDCVLMSVEMNPVYCVPPSKCWVAVSICSSLARVLTIPCFKLTNFCRKTQIMMKNHLLHHPVKRWRNTKTPDNKCRIRMMLKVPLKVTKVLAGTVTRKYLKKMMLCSVRPVNCGSISNARRSKPRHTSFWVTKMSKICTGFFGYRLADLSCRSDGWEEGLLYIHLLMTCVNKYTDIYDGIGLLAFTGLVVADRWVYSIIILHIHILMNGVLIYTDIYGEISLFSHNGVVVIESEIYSISISF